MSGWMQRHAEEAESRAEHDEELYLQIDKLQTRVAELIQVIRQVEYVYDARPGKGSGECAWCHIPERFGHKSDCSRQRVIEERGNENQRGDRAGDPSSPSQDPTSPERA